MSVRLVALMSLIQAAAAAPTTTDPACPALRAMTNADGRRFADVRIVAGQSFALSGGRVLGAMQPDDCYIDIAPDQVTFSCTWRPEGYEGVTRLYDDLVGRIEACLGVDLPPSTGPFAHGGAQALRRTEGEFALHGGNTELQVSLIEAPEDREFDIPAYHYVSLRAGHELGAAKD